MTLRLPRSNRTGTVRPGRIGPPRLVPEEIARPRYALDGTGSRRGEARVKSPAVVERMRRTGRLAAEILRRTGEAVAVGVTTDSPSARPSASP